MITAAGLNGCVRELLEDRGDQLFQTMIESKPAGAQGAVGQLQEAALDAVDDRQE